MSQHDEDQPETLQEQQIRVRQTLLGMIAVLVLLGACWYVVVELNRSAKLQSCMEQGRRNCVEPSFVLGGPRQ
jgi:flagellar biogenesis protein FliO